MKWNYVFLLSALLLGTQAFAGSYHVVNPKLLQFNFAAPTVPEASSLTNQPTGQIVFDISSHQFKGLDDSGNWDPMSTPSGNPVTSGGTSIRMEAGQVVCSNSSSSISSQTSSWMSSITNGLDAGTCNINFASGVFSSTPYCTATVLQSGDSANSGAYLQTVSNSGITLAGFLSGAAANVTIQIICVGSH